MRPIGFRLVAGILVMALAACEAPTLPGPAAADARAGGARPSST